MAKKAERTTAYIIETVAPIFNKYGYVGTSMSDLTEATGLTKGAIYGNFENKEALALSAFQYNQNQLLSIIDEKLDVPGQALDKLFSLIRFYRQYDVFTLPFGGCPILNVGVDAQNNNKLLSAAVKETIKEIEGKIALVLENGVNAEEIRLPVPPLQFAKQLFTMLQGAIAMATMTRDRKYLVNTIAYLEHLVNSEIEKLK
ncbi:TetR/AcrR family transcriptional regulator [Flagellimonas allohymeniacidonis]|uniref:TetR/AcrR family transcriptional regulator n=1 Tax=Flagellimonas allohymeniacidonis TaxID=2517819 RepID=A0A4Q8QEZ8_9FLAO|nr:TetR/AcrR family transcriptional regulator [Allomuricauda hymeniacidonis]TAI49045.1 TetR/AcrR family transcriptional regulator [Allomuricauda hymeniacidonis]